MIIICKKAVLIAENRIAQLPNGRNKPLIWKKFLICLCGTTKLSIQYRQ